MGYKWYDTYHHFCLLVCTGASGIRFWPLGVDFGSQLVDFGVRESTLGPHSQCLALGADFMHLRVGFGVCKNRVPSYDNFDKNTTKLQYNIDKKL